MKGLLTLIAALLLALPFWPGFLILFLLNEAVRIFVRLLLFKTRYQLLRNGQDNMYHSTRTTLRHRNLVVTIVSKDEIDINSERQRWSEQVFGKNIETYRKLMCTFTFKYGYGCLRDDSENFNIANHVKFYETENACDPIKKEVSEQEFLQDIVPNLTEEMSDSHPQWEWLIIPNVKMDNGNILHLRVLRCHHGYMDGVSLLLLLSENIFDWSKNLPWKRPPYVIEPRILRPPKLMQRLIFNFLKLLALCGLPTAVLVLLLCAVFGISARENGIFKVGTKYHFVSSTGKTDLIELKKRKGKRTTMDTVFITTTKRALYEFGKKRGLSNKNKDCFGEGILSTNFCDFARDENQEPGNRFYFSLYNIKLSDRSPLVVTPNVDCMLNKQMVKVVGRLPSGVIDWLSRHGGPDSLYVSNVPFTKEAGSICGGKVTDLWAWSSLQGKEAVTALFPCYDGKISCSITSRIKGLKFEDCQEIADLIVDEMNKFGAENSV